MPRIVASLFVFATFAGAPLASSAAPITVPTDLNVGDEYRLAFMTSTTRDATSTDIADYNAFVSGVATSEPGLAALVTTWTAIGSTATVDARDNTGTNPSSTGVPIYRLDDIRIANDNTDLWDGTIQDDFGVNEDGLPAASSVVWTGTRLDGTAFGSLELGASSVSLGWTDMANDIPWMEFGTDTAAVSHRWFAISGVLVVVPEPSTGLLLAMGLVVLALRRRGSH